MRIFTKKASILIWAIVLLTFLTSSFLYISIRIVYYVKYNEDNNTYINKKEEFLAGNIDISDDESGEKYEYSNFGVYTGVLYNNTSITLTGVIGPVSFIILSNGGTGAVYYSGTSNTGITNTGFSITNAGDLTITNSGGYTNYTINLVDKFPKEYTIYKEIGGKKIIKEIGEK